MPSKGFWENECHTSDLQIKFWAYEQLGEARRECALYVLSMFLNHESYFVLRSLKSLHFDPDIWDYKVADLL